MDLSIIIAAYNEEKHIRRCLESVLVQTFREFEVIIIDDGSTDQTFLICDNFTRKQRNFKVIHQENAGLISARMRGVKEATGRYVTFIDGDDWVEEKLYERLINPMLINPRIDISISAYMTDDITGHSKMYFQKKDPMIMTADEAVYEMFVHQLFNWSGCGKIYKKELIDNISNAWWSYNSYGEDTEMNWKVFRQAHLVYYSAESGYHYCNNSNSMMHRPLSMKNLVYIDRLERILNEIDEQSELYSIVSELLITYCINSLIRLYQSDDECIKEIEKCRSALLGTVRNDKRFVSNNDFRNVEYALLGKDKFQRMQINNIEKISQAYRLLDANADEIYIYGAGVIGMWLADILIDMELDFNGFVVTEVREMNRDLLGKPIFSLSEILDDGIKKGFLIAVNNRIEKEIEMMLNNRGFDSYSNVGKYSLSY